MPIHLPTESRREFLAQLGGALACAAAAERVDADCIAILNDTHIAKRPTAIDIRNASLPFLTEKNLGWGEREIWHWLYPTALSIGKSGSRSLAFSHASLKSFD